MAKKIVMNEIKYSVVQKGTQDSETVFNTLKEARDYVRNLDSEEGTVVEIRQLLERVTVLNTYSATRHEIVAFAPLEAEEEEEEGSDTEVA